MVGRWAPRSARAAILVGFLAVSLGLVSIASAWMSPQAGTGPIDLGGKGRADSIAPCGARSAVLGVVVRLRRGHAAAEIDRFVAAKPILRPRFSDHKPRSVAAADLFVDSRGDASVDSIRSKDSVENAGELLAQTSDMSLRSCDHQLRDQPKAGAIRDEVADALAEQGYATAAELASDVVAWTISDDPVDDTVLLVTAYVPGQEIVDSSMNAAGQHLIGTVPVLVVITRDGREVLDVGYAPWPEQ